MNYEDWEREVPETIKGDVLWKMKVYRLALFAAHLGWHDTTKLVQDRRTVSLSDQLYRARLVPSAPTSPKDTAGVAIKTALVSMNTRLALLEKVATGTTRDVMS